MLSRVADSIYWMSRYVERAENVARFIDVNIHLILDHALEDVNQWEPLVTTTGDKEIFLKRFGTASKENVLFFLTFDPENPNSILASLSGARENARRIREVISSEMWQQVNRFYLMVRSAAGAHTQLEAEHDFYTQVKDSSHLFNGITDATMSHGEGWNFARMGRMIERADKTSRILDVKYYILLPRIADVGTPFDSIQWAALLRSASALEMYRKKYHHILPEKVADFLILDREFPRSIHYCLNKAEESLRAISASAAGTFQNPAERLLGRLRSEFTYAKIEEIIRLGMHEYLDGFQTKLNTVGDAVFNTFFRVPVSTDSTS